MRIFHLCFHLIYDLHKIYARGASFDAPAAPCAEVYAVFLLEVFQLVVDAVLKALFALFAEHIVTCDARKALQLAGAPFPFSFTGARVSCAYIIMNLKAVAGRAQCRAC